jgi:hypothetical protein
MAVKLKELKDDAIIDVKLNKAYYLMVKSLSFYIFNQFSKETIEEDIKAVMHKKYEELTELQRHFYTLTLLLTEIEREAVNNKLFQEKEILERGDEGYVEPSED